jgi:hypothetical protein
MKTRFRQMMVGKAPNLAHPTSDIRPTTTALSIERPFHIADECDGARPRLSRHVNSLAALMHLSASNTRCRSQALRSRRVVLSRPSSLQGLSDSRSGRHFAAYTTVFAAQLSTWKGWKPCGPQILPLISFSACHHHYPGSLVSARSRCFLTSASLRRNRNDSASIRRLSVYPQNSDSPSNTCQSCALRGCSVRLMLRPADSVGATDWGSPCWAEIKKTPVAYTQQFRATVSGQSQPAVTGRASPLPIHPNGKLMNQTPFSPEEDEFQISYTVGTFDIAPTAQ